MVPPSPSSIQLVRCPSAATCFLSQSITIVVISPPPLYTAIHFICPYQYRGTSKPYTIASTITSVCVEHLFWCVTSHALPFITPHPTVGTLQPSIPHYLPPTDNLLHFLSF